MLCIRSEILTDRPRRTEGCSLAPRPIPFAPGGMGLSAENLAAYAQHSERSLIGGRIESVASAFNQASFNA